MTINTGEKCHLESNYIWAIIFYNQKFVFRDGFKNVNVINLKSK